MSEEEDLKNNTSSSTATPSVEFSPDNIVESPQEKSVLASLEFRFMVFASAAVLCFVVWLLANMARANSELLMLDFREWRPLTTNMEAPETRAFYESIQSAAPEQRAFRIVLQLPPNATAGESFGTMKRFPDRGITQSFRFLMRSSRTNRASITSVAAESVRVLVNGVQLSLFQFGALEHGELVEVMLPPGEAEVAIELVASTASGVRPKLTEALYIEFGRIRSIQP